MEKIILYTTHCPQCQVLKKKLDAEGIKYEENTNVEEMLALGLKSAPNLQVEGELLSFAKAIQWLNKNKNKEG